MVNLKVKDINFILIVHDNFNYDIFIDTFDISYVVREQVDLKIENVIVHVHLILGMVGVNFYWENVGV